MGRLARWTGVALRSWDALLREGPRGLMVRWERRRAELERIERRYPALVARLDAERPPARPDPPPLVSIVTPVKDPPIAVLRRAAESVLAQRGARVEWCVADDASARADVKEELRRLASADARVKVTLLESSRGIAGATNAALDLAKGELVGFLDHDDELHPDAVAWMQAAFSDPAVGAAYSDEDKLDEAGARCEPMLKPDFSPELLLSYNYVLHFFVARRALVEKLGRLRPFDGAQDHDLVLRLSEEARIAHVARPLYHWRKVAGSVAGRAKSKLWAYEAGKKAVREALERRGETGEVKDGAWLGTYRVERAAPGEVLVVELGEDLAERLRGAPGDVIAVAPPGVSAAPGALSELAAQARRRDVALATPRVLDARGRIEAAGWTLGLGVERLAGCPFAGRAADDPGYMLLAAVARDVSAAPPVFAIERTKLEALGGVPAVAAAHVGIALALRARSAGLRSVYAPAAIFQRATAAAPLHASAEDTAATRRLLGAELDREPFLSPHFVRGVEALELPLT